MKQLNSTGAVPMRKSIPGFKRIVAVACAAVFICGASIGAYAYYKTPASYLSLDINPSVELGVNSFGRVVSAMAYNKDGKTILDGQDIMGTSVKSAVKTLVKSASQNGFIADDGSTVIAVTSETDDQSTADKLEEDASQGADTAVKSEGDTATVQKENVALERRDEARRLGITPGKLNLIQKLQALDPSITVDEYKDAKVTQIMKKFVELKKATLKNSTSGSDASSESSSDTSGVSSADSSSESAGTAQTQLVSGKKTPYASSGSNSKKAASGTSAASGSSSSAGINSNANSNASHGQSTAAAHSDGKKK